jgi:predicted O-linked N-acetylglucosamine transferase (SPINDLY family)
MINKPIKITSIRIIPPTNIFLSQTEQSRFALGLSLFQTGRLNEAINALDNLLSINSNHLDAIHLSGVIYGQLKETKKAVIYFQKAIKLNPSNDELHCNLGNALADNNQFELAITHFDSAIQLNPKGFVAYSNRGRALHGLGLLSEALANYNKAIELEGNYTEAYYNRGIVLQALGKHDDALLSYENAIKLKHDYAEAYFNCGNVLKDLSRFKEALTSFSKAIEIKPLYAEAHHNCGIVLREMMLFDDSLSSYDKSLAINPKFAEAYNNRGILLLELKSTVLAIENFSKAIYIKPELAQAYSNRGNALKELKKYDAALLDYDRAISLNKIYAEAYFNKAVVLKELYRFDEAIINLERVYEINPNFPFMKGMLLHYMMIICNWDKFNNLFDKIKEDIINSKHSADPFGLQGVCIEESLLQKAARIFTAAKYPKKNTIPHKINANKRIKIGYLCGEFREHATSILMVNLWELHNKEKFEVIGLDNGWDDGSDIRKRILDSMDKLINITTLNDLEVSQLIKNESIDILINLNCFFGQQRNAVFSYKPAPIQVNYLGFPGSLGADYIDYIIADKIVIPEYSMEHYSEKIVFIPNTYQVNDRNRFVSKKVFTRKELGLPESSFVFCCFNNNYKITSDSFGGWMKILATVQDSVLWLLEDNPSAVINLKKEALIRGVEPNRLIFAKRISPADHLARHKVADLFLDTLPYNAHTTASDALWAGLPVLTCIGESFAGRVAASLLNAIELPELITTSQSQFEATAVDLATNPNKIKTIKEKLQHNRLTTALFDTSRFAKHIESAYTQMYERYQNNLLPDHIYIKSNLNNS